MKLLLVVLLLAGCALVKKPETSSEPTSWTPSVDLGRMHYDTLNAIPEGWPADTDCDGLLWAGLAAAVGHEVDLTAARDEAGLWHRRQVAAGECYPNEAESTVSRDMFVGLLVGLVEEQDAATIGATLAYAREHDGRMGDPWPGDGRTQWTGNLFALWARAAGEHSDVPVVFAPDVRDYELHLALVQTATYSRITGGLLPWHVRGTALKFAVDNPTDALAQAVACLVGFQGPCELAERLLLDPAYALPSYVRGPAAAPAIHKAFASQVLLWTE